MGAQQGGELVLVAVAGHVLQPGQVPGGVAAQAGLGIAQLPARCAAEQQGGHIVADPAAQRYRPGEPPHSQGHVPGLAHPRGHGLNVRRRVLPVGVGTHHVRIGPGGGRMGQPCAQRPPLALVVRVADHLGSAGAGGGEEGRVLRPRAVIDDEHRAVPARPAQAGHEHGQALVGLVGRDENHERHRRPGVGPATGPRRRPVARRAVRGDPVRRGNDPRQHPRRGLKGCVGAVHLRIRSRCRGCRRCRARPRWRAG